MSRCCGVCRHSYGRMVLQCVLQNGMSVPAKGFCEKFRHNKDKEYEEDCRQSQRDRAADERSEG